MNLKQALEDWILADNYAPTGSQVAVEATNRERQRLRRNLPSLLAKIEQHVLEARKDELKTFKFSGHMKEHLPFTRSKSSARHAQNKLRYILWDEIDERIAELDALLNTKEARNE